jgi:hypothetical protein
MKVMSLVFVEPVSGTPLSPILPQSMIAFSLSIVNQSGITLRTRSVALWEFRLLARSPGRGPGSGCWIVESVVFNFPWSLLTPPATSTCPLGSKVAL